MRSDRGWLCVKWGDWLKASGAVIVGLVLDIAAHGLVPNATGALSADGVQVLAPSAIVTVGLMVPALLGFLLITFGLLEVVFVMLQSELPYGKWLKGFVFGMSFGGIWYLGVLESTLVLGTAFGRELVAGLSDAIPILVMCVLLGGLVGTQGRARRRQPGSTVLAVPIVALCYLMGRYVAYLVFNIESGAAGHPVGTLVWTSAMGLCVGLMYWLLEPGLGEASPARRAIVFGGVVYGIDWALFNFFLVVLFQMNTLDLMTRVGVDVFSVMLGVLIAETAMRAGKRPS